MKILVSTPVEAGEKELANFNEGVTYLKKLGHNVVVSKNDNAGFKKIDKNIKDTDIFLVDITNADSKVGYEVARALEEKKVVVALEKEKNTNNFGSLIASTKNVIHKKYSTTNIVKVLEAAINDAKKKLDTKFILIISPEIDRYLDWASQTKRMHKAQIVRNAVEGMIKKDREYKNYIGE